ncbi:MAG: hypothetical protein MUF64_17640 [Polyangiaceae bacterium]|nr:hypothetical protein [Polyangiaceae bacterium]
MAPSRGAPPATARRSSKVPYWALPGMPTTSVFTPASRSASTADSVASVSRQLTQENCCPTEGSQQLVAASHPGNCSMLGMHSEGWQVTSSLQLGPPSVASST